MAYVIAEPCINAKKRDCVPECPVDCIFEYDEASGKLVVKDSQGKIMRERDPNPDISPTELLKQLFISPDECIDCGACVDACPTVAIFFKDDLPDKWKNFADINKNAFASM